MDRETTKETGKKMDKNLYKYPRTFHLPWSDGSTSDDKVLSSIDHFVGKEVVVTEKMDGENTNIYRDYIHARSLDSSSHVSQSVVKSLQGEIGWQIPEGFRICGENLYARHSISYKGLKSYFQVFSIWENDTCLSWEDTVEWASLLNLVVVPVLWKGIWNEEAIRKCMSNSETQEGYVVRVAGLFEYSEFRNNVAKYVRPNHVQSDIHWKNQTVVPNILK